MRLPSLSKLPNQMTMMTLAKLPIKLPPQFEGSDSRLPNHNSNLPVLYTFSQAREAI